MSAVLLASLRQVQEDGDRLSARVQRVFLVRGTQEGRASLLLSETLPMSPEKDSPLRGRRLIGDRLEGRSLRDRGFAVHHGRMQLTWDDGQILEIQAAEGGRLKFRLYPKSGYVITEE